MLTDESHIHGLQYIMWPIYIQNSLLDQQMQWHTLDGGGGSVIC